VELTADERTRIEKKPTENLRAYNLDLLGRHHINQHPQTQDSLDTAASFFQQAIDEDPAFGAWSSGTDRSRKGQILRQNDTRSLGPR
jgi:hypothetical protein